jgi:hypothetical protein
MDNPTYSGSISRKVNCRRQLSSTESIKLLSEIPSTRNSTNLAEETRISLNGKESSRCAHDEINKMIQNVEGFNLSTEKNNLILKCFLPKVYTALLWTVYCLFMYRADAFLMSRKISRMWLGDAEVTKSVSTIIFPFRLRPTLNNNKSDHCCKSHLDN